MNRRHFLKTTMGVGAVLFGAGRTGAARAGRHPNVVFIITDDQKLDTFGFLDKKAYTPSIDKLASESMYFSRAYVSSSVCTPTRFSCLTGMYASRASNHSFKKSVSSEGQTDVQWNTDMVKGQKTVAHALQSAGYVTGFAGKWHNGNGGTWRGLSKKLKPNDDPADPEVAALLKAEQDKLHTWVRSMGFDYAESVNLGNFSSHPLRALRHHNPEWITKGALDFIDRNRDKPFFLYMATTLMHGPSPMASLKQDPRKYHAGLLPGPLDVQPSRESVIKRAKEKGIADRLIPATWLDDSIGAVLDKLESLGLDENTVVFYFNDHGVEQGKGSCYEGGVRTPAFVRWKGKVNPGKSDALIQNVDFVPTIMDICGATPPATLKQDGKSLVPLMKGQKGSVHESLYFEIGHTRGVCTKKWKYIAFRIPPSKQLSKEERVEIARKYAARKASIDKKVETDPDAPLSHLGFPGGQDTEKGNAIKRYAKTYHDADQLYDLENDPGERKNLAEDPAYAAQLGRMKDLLKEHLAGVPGVFAEFKG